MTDKGVAALEPRAKRYVVADHRRPVTGSESSQAASRAFGPSPATPTPSRIWTDVGLASIGIKASREIARTALQRVRDGLSAFEPPAESFGAVATNWLKRHVDANGLVNAPKIKYLLKKHVLPRWKDREATSIRKSDIAALLDRIEDNHSASTADSVLEVVRSILNWHATRTDDFNPPLSRGMKRSNKTSRERTLDDDELRLIWKAAESSTSVFGTIVRMCLLTRRNARARWRR